VAEGVSLLITTNGRAELLRRSLARFQDAGITWPDEVVVVDDGTPDDSVGRVCDAATRWSPLPLPVKYIRLENPGMTNCCYARNVGLRVCAYDEVITSEPELWFISDVIGQLKAARVQFPDKVVHEANAFHEPFEGAHLTDCDTVPGFYVNSFRREWLFEVGGWDEGFPGPWGFDDIDLYGRLSHAGHDRLGFPEIKVLHRWHESRIDGCPENEPYARAKEFPRDIVANKDHPWGQIR
jgi:glycosyltransferase involved in cell wall biosynthesis